MNMIRIACLALWSATASAGVIVVDQSNGPGTDFVTLQAGIAAAQNGDLLLVRSGTYDAAHFIIGKSISIVADAGASVLVTNSQPGTFGDSAIHVFGTFNGNVVLRGLSLSTPLPQPTDASPSTLRLAGGDGGGAHVFVEDCTVATSGGEGMRIEGDTAITVTHCAARGADGFIAGGTFRGPLPGTLLADIKSSVFQCTTRGGDGFDAAMVQFNPTAGSPGAPGLQVFSVSGATSLVSNSQCVGGDGGDATNVPTCLAPGNGGTGVFCLVGTTHLVQTPGTGGLPGSPVAPCNQVAQPGAPIAASPFGQPPIVLAGQPGGVTAPPPRREGQATTIVVDGPVSHAAFLVIGFSPTRVFAPQLAGTLVATPDAILALGSLPPSGAIAFGTHAPTLPVGVESAIVYLQAITQDPTSGQATLGAPSALVILDASF